MAVDTSAPLPTPRPTFPARLPMTTVARKLNLRPPATTREVRRVSKTF
jgi:hypothetical protein